jgi:hypothetical protein
MNTDDDMPSSATVVVGVFVVYFVVGAILRAFVISTLWGWFVAPAFHLPEISMSTAFGFGLLASMFTNPSTADTKDKGWWDLVGMMFGQLVGFGFTLALGWLVHTLAS